jgi:CheY-like chemotaxis protein
MALILAIQPDSTQIAVLRQALSDSANADVVVVDSVDAALAVVDETVPDLVLLDEFTPPRDADTLIAYLRVLPDTDHVQAISVPVIQTAVSAPEARQEPGKYRWLSQLLKEPQRSAAAPAGCDPDVFAADVIEYLERTKAIKDERSYRRVPGYSEQATDRRRTARKAAGDVPFVSARLITHSADLVNVSAGGALLRMEVRPVPRDTGRDFQSRSTLTLLQSSGEEIRQTGRPIRCHVRPIGEGRMLYEVAFQFDTDLGLLLQGLEKAPRAETPAAPRVRHLRVAAR